MVERCESLLTGNTDRQATFGRLVAAKGRVEHLTAGQLCRRDLKVVTSPAGQRVALSSVPMLAKQWTEKPRLEEEVNTFLTDGGYSMVFVLGIMVDPQERVTRDIVIVGDSQCIVYKTVLTALIECNCPPLGLSEDKNTHAVESMIRFSQDNIGASRKQILPIVKASIKNM